MEVAVAGLITAWLVRQVLSGSLSLANYSFYTGVVFQFGSSLNLIVNSLNGIYDSNEYMKDLFWLFDLKASLPQTKDPQKISTQSPPIAFENVSFKYPGTHKWALKKVSFVINPGDKVAFVGENGAGKTTIIKLLLRFYDVTEGRILINGIDIRELDLHSYYNHIGVLFQNFNDYPFTVRDNIALGRVEQFKNDSAVYESAIIADADGFIQKYPKKYDQVLDISFKDGIEPSGGQWQRIALARALFRNSDILILDEPTAAVDAKSEYEIFKTLEKHSSQKTNIIISHRFSTVRRVSTIYVLKNGTIVEQGTHPDLMKIKDGLYSEMFSKQAEGYK